MSIAFAFYVLRIVRVIYCVRECQWCVSGQWPFIKNKSDLKRNDLTLKQPSVAVLKLLRPANWCNLTTRQP